MILPCPWPQCLDFFGTPIVIEPSAGQLSSAAGRGESAPTKGNGPAGRFVLQGR